MRRNDTFEKTATIERVCGKKKEMGESRREKKEKIETWVGEAGGRRAREGESPREIDQRKRLEPDNVRVMVASGYFYIPVAPLKANVRDNASFLCTDQHRAHAVS